MLPTPWGGDPRVSRVFESEIPLKKCFMNKFLLSMASLMLLLGGACNDDNGEGGEIFLPSR